MLQKLAANEDLTTTKVLAEEVWRIVRVAKRRIFVVPPQSVKEILPDNKRPNEEYKMPIWLQAVEDAYGHTHSRNLKINKRFAFFNHPPL